MSADVKGGHTPGPWIPVYDARRLSRWRIEGAGGDAWVADVVQLAKGDFPEFEANARLISAAPDYSAAAAMIIEAFSCAPDEVIAGAFGDDMLAALKATRAAHAKAEGPSS